jgi:hypothetical protein
MISKTSKQMLQQRFGTHIVLACNLTATGIRATRVAFGGIRIDSLCKSCGAWISVAAFNLILSGCTVFSENVWQPTYAGARQFKISGCGVRAPISLEIRLRDSSKLWVHPEYINRDDGLSLFLVPAQGTTPIILTDNVTIEASGNVLHVPLKYRGELKEVTSSDKPNSYRLDGRLHPGFAFQVRTDMIEEQFFTMEISILTEQQLDNQMVRVRFDRHRAYIASCQLD